MATASVTIDRNTPAGNELVLAVELTELHLVSALIDRNARVVTRQIRGLPGTSVQKITTTIAAAALEHSSSRPRGDARIRAIGVCVPGHVDPLTLRVSAPGMFSWTRVALKPALERALDALGVDIRTPSSNIKARAARSTTSQPAIAISNRRACEVAGEVWAGAARGRRDVINLSIAHSIEAGIMVNGAIVRGAGGFSGMISRFAGDVSANGLMRHAIEALPGAPASVLTGIMAEEPSSLTARAIILAARGGDGLALALVGNLCGALGRLAGNLISILGPEMVVIGGEFGLELKPFASEIRRAVMEWAHSDSGRWCRVTFSTLGAQARLLGAARLAMA